MFPMDSSSASSPFSTLSTDTSSPEASGSGVNDHKPRYMSSGREMMQGMHGMFNGFPPNSFPSYPNAPNFLHHTSPPTQDIKPSFLELERSIASTHVSGSNLGEGDGDGLYSAGLSIAGAHTHGGSRSEPPRRLMEVEGLGVVNTPSALLAATPNMNLMLLQGDPQAINKQRVETAIRVIIDLLRHIPPTPTSPPIHPSLSPLLLRDSLGNIMTTLERIDTFTNIRLQSGTTTKKPSKKQIQAGPTPPEQLAYLETAVYMSGPGEYGKRVYACRRCRMREAKRRVSKETSKKKVLDSESESSSNKVNKVQRLGPSEDISTGDGHQPATLASQDYIKGENSEQYDPMRGGQVVEEPVWDPGSTDWRHEIVLFNSPPEIGIKDGSCVWLPFRVVCYGKCHGEKVGFRIRFTLRSHTGDIIATALTPPIRITDDHKTESKGKPKMEGLTSSTNPKQAVTRRKPGRRSGASSRHQSAAPSEAESIHSRSEAGAFMQKQTPQVRAGKPYERPATQSPLTGSMPMEGPVGIDMVPPPFTRKHSGTSIHSMSSVSRLAQSSEHTSNPMTGGVNEFPIFDPVHGRGTVSPGALRRPQFDFTPLDGFHRFAASSTHSASSSNVASPLYGHSRLHGDDLLFAGESPNDLMRALVYNNPTSLPGPDLRQIRQQQAPMVSGFNDSSDVEMSNAIISSFDNIFDTSSHHSLSSSYDEEGTSAFSTNIPDGSLFSDSGLVPDDMQGFLDFSGGEDQGLAGPTFPASPPGMLFDIRGAMSSQSSAEQDRQIGDILASFNPHSNPTSSSIPGVLAPQRAVSPPLAPNPNSPSILTVIPSEGPVAGGTTVAIIGTNFTQGIAVMFGDRPAKIQKIDPTFIQCLSPPAIGAGMVEVGIQGVVRSGTSAPSLFRYNMMDTDLMRLALQVKDQYQGSSGDAAYRLAHHVASRSRSAGSDWSDANNSASPINFGSTRMKSSSSSPDPKTPEDSPKEKEDLENTVLTFLASLDEDAPGSLRRSGVVNTRNEAQQTLLHIATVMGYHRLLRRLVFIGAHMDLQDTNGYTPLGLASLSGQVNCARVLIEAGAAYDRPTKFGEMPLDLAKVGEHEEVEALLLSAVWSTALEPDSGGRSVSAVSHSLGETSSEIDDDNPSSDDDGEGETGIGKRMSTLKPKRLSRRGRGRQSSINAKGSSPMTGRSRRSSLSILPVSDEIVDEVGDSADEPPPYEAPVSPIEIGSWMSRTLSSSALGLSHSHFKLPLPCADSVLNRLPQQLSTPLHSLFDRPTEAGAGGSGWIAFPAPSWETIQRMTSPDEVRLFTQAMAAAAFNAVVQSGATSGGLSVGGMNVGGDVTGGRGVKRRVSGKKRRGSSSGVSTDAGKDKQVVQHIKRDRMLYLFWLPILLFVGFWLMVTAVPIATGFCLIYARQITRAIKQRM